MFATIDPVLFFFLLGIIGGLAKSDLHIPGQINDTISIYLLLAIGLKGGLLLHGQPLAPLALPVLATIIMGCLIPVVAFFILYKIGKFKVVDAAALAAHFGSTSVITFAVARNVLERQHIEHEPFMVVLLVILEIPAIIVGLLLAKTDRRHNKVPWKDTLREVALGKSILLLVGALLVGMINGPEKMADINRFFVDPFKGVLAVFMVGMGVAAAGRLSELRQVGFFLIGFSIIMPVISASIGILTGFIIGLSEGGVILLAVLAASASYIAAPAAVRVALPDANPGYYLVASLGITFPFNVFLGIPLYIKAVQWLAA